MWKYFIWPVLTALILLVLIFQPCESGLFIGGCMLGRIFAYTWLIVSIIVYSLLSRIYSKFIDAFVIWKSILLLLAVQVFSIVIVSPILAPLVFAVIGLWGWLK
jgi:hypothetical protein